ncbi:glycosyltransferase [Aquabacterium sp.]|uniref:glycosyltransferase n=1 Tax=Aquabacterium sp. TaxID=1872578 RepID=UPI003D6D1A8F
MRRIAIVTPILPVPFDPARGRFIYEIAKSLSKIADVRVFFQLLEYPLASVKTKSYVYGELQEGYTLEGIDVESFSYPAIPVISRGLNGFVSSRVLAPRLKKFNPDVVIGYWVYPDGYAAQKAAKQLNIPCVIGALGSDIHLRSGLNHYLTRQTLRKADAVITVSEAMRQYTIDEFGAAPDKTTTIVNGFNTSVFHGRPQGPDRERLNIPVDQKLMVYVGRFVEAKGLNELLAAFSNMAQADPLVRLALIGDGVMKAQLVQAIESAGLKGKIYLPGNLVPAEVATWIGASDLLTLPSWSEGYPNVVVEGVACGRPVVATDVGGTREIINGDNGILVRPKDVKSLQNGLTEALSRQWDHEGIANAMRRTWDDVAQDTLNVCEELLARRSPLSS